MSNRKRKKERRNESKFQMLAYHYTYNVVSQNVYHISRQNLQLIKMVLDLCPYYSSFLIFV